MQIWPCMIVTMLGMGMKENMATHHVNGSDDDGDDMKKPQCELWHQSEESLEQNDDEVFDDDD